MEKTLHEAIKEYSEAIVAFNANIGVSSKPLPPKIQAISDRFFAARTVLEEVCKESDEVLAQRYFEAATLAHECTTLMLDDPSNNLGKCIERMKVYRQAEKNLLNAFK